jgi:hypothetical protein
LVIEGSNGARGISKSSVPEDDLVANFVNSLGSISGSIPWPISFILTTISESFFSVRKNMVPFSFVVNLTAFNKRLEITNSSNRVYPEIRMAQVIDGQTMSTEEKIGRAHV